MRCTTRATSRVKGGKISVQAMRPAVLLFLVLCVHSVSSAAGSEPPPPAFDDTVRVVVIGSSSAQGAGAKPGESSWVRRYERHVRGILPASRFINLAMGGYTSYHCLPNDFPSDPGRPRVDTMRNITRALSLRPSVLLISLPTNDIADGFDTSEYYTNMRIITAEADRDSIPYWICSSQPRNLDSARRVLLGAARGWIRERYHPRSIDFWDTVADSIGFVRPEFDFGDGVHVNNAGHALFYERVKASGIIDTLRALRDSRLARIGAQEPVKASTQTTPEAYPSQPARTHVDESAAPIQYRPGLDSR